MRRLISGFFASGSPRSPVSRCDGTMDAAITGSIRMIPMNVRRLSGSSFLASSAVFFFTGVFSCGWLTAGTAMGQSKGAPEWTTSSYNAARDAWQRHETKITPQNAAKIQMLWKLKTDNKTMGMQSFREPLIVSGVKTDKGT